MKVKNGKLSLGKDDVRVGNFVISKEKQHYKMQDINGYWTTRVSYQFAMYMLIEECIKAKNMDYLETIAKMLYALSVTPPDAQMIKDMYDAYNALMGRMRNNGITTEAEDAKALEDVKNAYEAKEEMKKILDGKPEGDKDR